MRLKKILPTMTMLVLLFILPSQAFAVEYTIDQVIIEAELQENGNVQVWEWHTYSFQGDFNGIIRELVPKQGSNIVNFQAFERSETLPVETDGYTHRIHRSGKDEQITVELNYVIENGVAVYADIAEFYWPFFDERNESTYDAMTITVFPPAETTDVQAFGRDEAFEKASSLPSGAVRYDLGTVPKGENGDIRVLYPAELFSAADVAENTNKKEAILSEEAEYAQLVANRSENQQRAVSIGKVVLPITIFLFIAFVLRDILKQSNRKKKIIAEDNNVSIVPEETLTLPATVFFTNHRQLLPETMAAALLDLTRKGNVIQTGEESFQAVHWNHIKAHEEELMTFLFETVGHEGKFTLSDLTLFSEDEKNSSKYTSFLEKWRRLIAQEVNEKNFYKNVTRYRVLHIGLGVLLLPLAISFLIHDLVGMFFITVGLFLAYLIYGLLYQEKSYSGSLLFYRWHSFRSNFSSLSKDGFTSLSKEEQMRAFLYCLAMGDDMSSSNNQDLLRAFKERPLKQETVVQPLVFDPASSFYSASLISQSMSSSFRKADENLQPSGDSSSFDSGGGSGGVGGGGGGSGAF
ncbi:Uncharacterized membrane protein [Evansella caseinilytica]|uniref:Uncharacterized membrane protein n=1 Tax=Evansella caseinilytica TaxID=1503961 RepID=A0A1H3H1Q7_9BACI|nr:DUF2207 domain-containing protein [Evansella caseinilytica]SDY08704.1 Uncharacterized membrane protein [Evansella caseinilytica]